MKNAPTLSFENIVVGYADRSRLMVLTINGETIPRHSAILNHKNGISTSRLPIRDCHPDKNIVNARIVIRSIPPSVILEYVLKLRAFEKAQTEIAKRNTHAKHLAVLAEYQQLTDSYELAIVQLANAYEVDIDESDDSDNAVTIRIFDPETGIWVYR